MSFMLNSGWVRVLENVGLKPGKEQGLNKCSLCQNSFLNCLLLLLYMLSECRCRHVRCYNEPQVNARYFPVLCTYARARFSQSLLGVPAFLFASLLFTRADVAPLWNSPEARLCPALLLYYFHVILTSPLVDFFLFQGIFPHVKY